MNVNVQNVGIRTTIKAEVLRTPWARARGYMFRRPPAADEGLLFVYRRPRKVVLHMFGVSFPLDVAWLDSNNQVIAVDTMKPWKGMATSPRPVSAFLECAPGIIQVGDRLEWT